MGVIAWFVWKSAPLAQVGSIIKERRFQSSILNGVCSRFPESRTQAQFFPAVIERKRGTSPELRISNLLGIDSRSRVVEEDLLSPRHDG